LNINLIVFDHLMSKKIEKLKKIKFHTPFTYKYRGQKNSKKIKKIKPSHLFYILYFKFLYNCFLNFVVQKINSKMVKSGMVVLTEREKVDADRL
jgi:hypothetical protein